MTTPTASPSGPDANLAGPAPSPRAAGFLGASRPAVVVMNQDRAAATPPGTPAAPKPTHSATSDTTIMAVPPHQTNTTPGSPPQNPPPRPAPGIASIGDATLQAEARALNFHYGKFHALKSISLPIARHRITALIGPSGCGKSTFLRCFNRMHDLYPNNRYDGELLLYPDKINLVGPSIDPIAVRMQISMVFQKPNPFPKSIFENVAFPLRLRGGITRKQLEEEVEKALRGAAIWDETKDRLNDNAYRLSGGQQQRLCIARSLASHPEIVLFDEPTSALDPAATMRIEELMLEMRDKVTVVVVTHNMQQASRVSDFTAFMYMGELVEFGPTARVFQTPAKRLTEEYISGRFG